MYSVAARDSTTRFRSCFTIRRNTKVYSDHPLFGTEANTIQPYCGRLSCTTEAHSTLWSYMHPPHASLDCIFYKQFSSILKVYNDTGPPCLSRNAPEWRSTTFWTPDQRPSTCCRYSCFCFKTTISS